MDKFWELLSESVIIQSAVTLVLVVGCTYMAIRGDTIPDVLINATMISLGFYFGNKSQQSIMKMRR